MGVVGEKSGDGFISCSFGNFCEFSIGVLIVRLVSFATPQSALSCFAIHLVSFGYQVTSGIVGKCIGDIIRKSIGFLDSENLCFYEVSLRIKGRSNDISIWIRDLGRGLEVCLVFKCSDEIDSIIIWL